MRCYAYCATLSEKVHQAWLFFVSYFTELICYIVALLCYHTLRNIVTVPFLPFVVRLRRYIIFFTLPYFLYLVFLPYVVTLRAYLALSHYIVTLCVMVCSYLTLLRPYFNTNYDLFSYLKKLDKTFGCNQLPIVSQRCAFFCVIRGQILRFYSGNKCLYCFVLLSNYCASTLHWYISQKMKIHKKI